MGLNNWLNDNLFIKNTGRFSGNLNEIPSVYKNICAFVQKSMEEAAIKKVQYLMDKHKVQNLCLSGGVALNCLMNSQIRKNISVKNLFIPPAAGDSGQSVGNAAYGYYKTNHIIPKLGNFDVYMGSDVEAEQIKFNPETMLKVKGEERADLAGWMLNKGNIIGWCQGRSEWGPRALGNRSILCSAHNKDTVQRLFEAKQRNWFETLAGSVLYEDADVYFDGVREEQPYMLQVANIKTVQRSDLHFYQRPEELVAAPTCRLQTVTKERNPTFAGLLNAYKKHSGQSLVINTSLNARGKPICETGNDALAYFRESKLDAMFIENYVMCHEAGKIDAIRDYLNGRQPI